MGVPSYFFWLINKYSRKILKGRITGPSVLFLDLNCAIHPAVKANPDFTIPEMLCSVIRYIDDIIAFTKNVQFIYIAIDGVAPVAKMQQQRLRRYKSKMFAEAINSGKTDFNMISPGTEFMAMLNAHIAHNYAVEIAAKRIIFSSSDEPGEGEHKIFHYIRGMPRHNNNLIIYGLDSDLIFLSLINYNNNSTLLLREKEQYGKMAQGGEKYVYLDINYLRNIIYSMLRTASHQPITRIITDYVFFSFFLGNDFLPCIPTLFIREGGIELLMQCYTQILTELDEYLIDEKYEINERFICAYVALLASAEQDCINKYIEERKKRMVHMKKNDAYIEGQTPDLIYEQFPHASWKKRHYAYYFDIVGKSEIKKIWASYLTGMMWALRYYIGIPVSWEWHYYYNVAPALSDFKLCVWNNDDISNMNVPTCLEQLLYIMPRQSAHLLPKCYQVIMENIKRYPPEKEIKYCLMNKKYIHEAICYLPEINLKIIRKMIRGL